MLKRTGEEGVVSALINKQMVEVEVGGTAFPVYMEDVDHPYLKWFTEKSVPKKKASLPEQLPVEKPAAPRQRLARGVYLSFMPVFKTVDMEELVSHVKVFLLNELPVNVRFTYDVRIKDASLFRHEANLHAFGNIYLHSVEYADMNEQPRFQWTLADAGNAALAKEEGVLRIRPAKLFEHISKVLEGSEPSFSYLLADDFKEPVKQEPLPPVKPVIGLARTETTQARPLEPAKHEVDLHIEKLVGSPRGMSNAEIIKIQLNALQRYLQLAIVHRQERMIVIHGLGKGKLREEVHALLKATPEVARFKTEWSGRYGFGATEVIFKV